MFVCPAANLAPTVVQIVNRNRRNAAVRAPKLYVKDDFDGELTPEEARRETRNCILVIAISLIAMAIFIAFGA